MKSLFQNIGIREMRLLLLGAGLVISTVVASAVLLPMAKQYSAATREVSVLEEAEANSPNLERHLQERHEKIEELKFRLNGDITNLPFKQVESYVLGRLQKISWRNDVELVSVEPASGQQVQIFRELLFNIEITGEYDDVYRWLWDAKKELGFTVVKEYAMKRRDNVDDHPQLLAEVSLASYRVEE